MKQQPDKPQAEMPVLIRLSIIGDLNLSGDASKTK